MLLIITFCSSYTYSRLHVLPDGGLLWHVYVKASYIDLATSHSPVIQSMFSHDIGDLFVSVKSSACVRWAALLF